MPLLQHMQANIDFINLRDGDMKNHIFLKIRL